MGRYPVGGKPATPSHLEEFKKRVETGEMNCAKPSCTNTATKVITVTRTFVAWTEVVDVAVCDKHDNYYF